MNFNLDLNTLVLLIVAIMTATTTFYTRKTEKNTNSMKDALVAASHVEGKAEGVKEERLLGEQKAAAVASGLLQGQVLVKDKFPITISENSLVMKKKALSDS